MKKHYQWDVLIFIWSKQTELIWMNRQKRRRRNQFVFLTMFRNYRTGKIKRRSSPFPFFFQSCFQFHVGREYTHSSKTTKRPDDFRLLEITSGETKPSVLINARSACLPFCRQRLILCCRASIRLSFAKQTTSLQCKRCFHVSPFCLSLDNASELHRKRSVTWHLSNSVLSRKIDWNVFPSTFYFIPIFANNFFHQRIFFS